MITRRGWFAVFLLTCAFLITMVRVQARATDCPAPQRTPITCSEIRACIALAGGIEEAKRLAREHGYSEFRIDLAVKACRLKG